MDRQGVSLTRQAFDRIRDAIVSGALEFGEHLSETDVANALGMSKAPVRAAFMELRDLGLVNIVPQAGTYVFSPTPDDVRTMSHFRALLENQALTEAMKRRPDVVLGRLDDAIAQMKRAVTAKNWETYRRADSAFHMAFMEEAGNRYYLKSYQLTAAALEALRVRLQAGTGGFREQSFREHIEIADLLRGKKIAKAAALLRYHILIINESLDTMPPLSSRASRKDKGGDRDYAATFGDARPTP